ncbi:MAG: hypothetical protein ACFFG0_17770 [Candidatus Thorarchaeota archaeon]
MQLGDGKQNLGPAAQAILSTIGAARDVGIQYVQAKYGTTPNQNTSIQTVPQYGPTMSTSFQPPALNNFNYGEQLNPIPIKENKFDLLFWAPIAIAGIGFIMLFSGNKKRRR